MAAATPSRIETGGGDRILVFGGPYSNLQATQAMRAQATALGIGPRNVICNGDIAAYCAHPQETIDEIRDWGIHVIQGNCEEQLAVGADDCACGLEAGSACAELASDWYAYANAGVTPQARTFMGGLAKQARFDFADLSFAVLHGSREEINRFVFASTPAADKQRDLDALQVDVVLAGHCGVPFIQAVGTGAWFNAGVIGMPANDGTCDGWYGLITARETGIELSTHRLAYDVAAAAAALEARGFADAYAQTLRNGLWPSLDILPEAERAQAGCPLPEDRLSLSTAD